MENVFLLSCQRKLASSSNYSALRTPHSAFQKGFFILTMVVLIIIMALVAATTAYLFTTGSRSSTHRLLSSQAYYLAEAGLERGTFALLTRHVTSTDALTKRYTCASTSFSNQALGEGVFTVTPTATDVASSLSIALGASDTTIALASTTGFASRGRVRIDREVMDYYGISGSNLTGVVRGRDGTTAVSHASGTNVGQYQCVLESQGGVPDLTSPVAKRVLKQAVQLQKAWVVGKNAGGAETLARWDGVTWTLLGPSASIPDVSYRGISMLSYADGWAVGDSGNILHYSGGSWSAFVDTGNTSHYGVYCVTASDCWAVDDANKFWRYNGTSWSEFDDLGGTALNAVNCVATNDCWAVGASGKFFHFNGTSWSEFVDLGGDTARDVYCVSASDCWAVGNAGKIYRFNGTSWGEFDDLGTVILEGVFCTGSSDCWAVGRSKTFARWNGTSWSVVSTAALSTVTYFAVTCYHRRDCWASGESGNLAHWDGSSWSPFTNTLPLEDLFDIDKVGPRQRPQAAWEEDFH